MVLPAEKYLREVWPAVTRALKEVGVGCELNLVEGSMTVRTTRKVRTPQHSTAQVKKQLQDHTGCSAQAHQRWQFAQGCRLCFWVVG